MFYCFKPCILVTINKTIFFLKALLKTSSMVKTRVHLDKLLLKSFKVGVRLKRLVTWIKIYHNPSKINNSVKIFQTKICFLPLSFKYVYIKDFYLLTFFKFKFIFRKMIKTAYLSGISEARMKINNA